MKMLGLAAVCILCSAANAAPPATQPVRNSEIEVAYLQATRAAGGAYLTARDRLLGLPRPELNSFLDQRRTGATEPLQQLWLEALTLRLSQPRQVQAEVDGILAGVGQSATQPAAASRPQEAVTRPIHAAGAFANRFGAEATALCEEMLVRQTLPPEAVDQKQVLVLVLALQGQTRRTNGELQPARDPRAGAVLLWVLEHEDNQEILSLAAASLRRFTSDATITAATKLRAKATTPARQKILSECLRGLVAEQQILRQKHRATSKPDAPAKQDKPHTKKKSR